MFKDIEEFKGLYQINENGEVFSVRRNKILKPKIDRYGYYTVCLWNGKNNYRTVHRLVAQTFLKKKEGCNIVNHLDSNKLNNNVKNLEWTTISGNTKHCYDNNEKFRQQVLNNAKKGTEKRKNKISIRGISFDSQEEASKYFGVNRKTIYNWLH